MAKKVPTRAVPTLSAQARNFVLQGQPEPPPAPPVAPPAAAPAPAPQAAIQAPEPAAPTPPAPPPVAPSAPPAAPPPSAATSKNPRTGASSAATTPSVRRPRSVVSRADGRTLRRLQLYFDADVARKLKHHCVEHDVDMSAYVNDLVARALRG